MTSVKRQRLVKEFQPQPDPHPIDPRNKLKLVAGDFYITKKNDMKPLGEDAFFISKEYHMIGVADGVGGWARKGIDVGEYAHELMANALFSIKSNYQEGENIDPKLVLNEAFLNTEAKGLSTACIVTLKNTCSHSFLQDANIGDSGFIVIRGDRIMYRSPVQQDGFNCPYQLGNSSPYSPNSAMDLVFPVVDGDIVVLGTDGLFDNMFGYEIAKLVKLGMTDPEVPELPELLAWLIGQYALHRAEDDTYLSAFSIASQIAGYRHVGGKYNDITVVVAYVRWADDDSDVGSFDVLC